jgi:hypothetical protein
LVVDEEVETERDK